VIRDEWKYLAFYRWLPPERRGKSAEERPPLTLDDAPIREELYDLGRDPLEQHDLSAESPRRLMAMRAVLAEYLDSTDLDEASRRSAEEESAAEISPETLERLRALGYRRAD
jgi:hypothetical protein